MRPSRSPKLSALTIAATILLLACGKIEPYSTFRASDEQLEIVAHVSRATVILSDSSFRFLGNVTVVNRSSKSQQYGNRFLIFTADDGRSSRTYLDAPHSDIVDFSTKTISPADSLVLNVFWVFAGRGAIHLQGLRFDRPNLETFLQNQYE